MVCGLRPHYSKTELLGKIGVLLNIWYFVKYACLEVTVYPYHRYFDMLRDMVEQHGFCIIFRV